jgi:hypothetical protein
MQNSKITTIFQKSPRISPVRTEVENLLENSRLYWEMREEREDEEEGKGIEKGESEEEKVESEEEDEDGDNGRHIANNDKSEGEKRRDYELGLIFNKISLNCESEKLRLMQDPQGQYANSIVNGRTIRIQAGILSAAEMGILRALGYHIEEFRAIESLDMEAEGLEAANVPLVPKSIRITMFPNSKNPPLVEMLDPAEESPLDCPMDTTNLPRPVETTGQPPEEQPINPPEPVDPPEQQPVNPPNVEPITPIEPINPSEPMKTLVPTQVEQPAPKQLETDRKPEEQQIPNGWIDGHSLETTPNAMTASCVIHFYTEEQRNQLEQTAHGQLQNMLDQNKHLSQYYAQKDSPSQGSGWNLGMPQSY